MQWAQADSWDWFATPYGAMDDRGCIGFAAFFERRYRTFCAIIREEALEAQRRGVILDVGHANEGTWRYFLCSYRNSQRSPPWAHTKVTPRIPWDRLEHTLT